MFTEDFGVFFNDSDFATSAFITLANGATRQIPVIFDAVTQGINLYDTKIEANTPNFQCKTSDLDGVKNRAAVVIESKNYTIERTEPDGTGVTTVYLKG